LYYNLRVADSEPADPRVLVAGVGAVGAWVLARLTDAGADVTGWTRGSTYERLAAGDPLVLSSPEGDWAGPVRVTTTPAGEYDLVLVCVKAHDTAAIAVDLPRGARVVSIQNGVENISALAAHHDRVSGAVVYCGCERLGPTEVRHEFPGGHLVVDDEALASWFDRHGLPAKMTDDVRAALWRKLLVNVVGNGLTAVTRHRFGRIFATPEIEPVARAALAETAAVARAEGVELDDSDIDASLSMLGSMPAEKTSSTLQDLEAGRALEVELTGSVVRLAEAHGIETPTVRTLDALLRVISP
jgi:2-dehydropantoate 2-reductase